MWEGGGEGDLLLNTFEQIHGKEVLGLGLGEGCPLIKSLRRSEPITSDRQTDKTENITFVETTYVGGTDEFFVSCNQDISKSKSHEK